MRIFVGNPPSRHPWHLDSAYLVDARSAVNPPSMIASEYDQRARGLVRDFFEVAGSGVEDNE